MKRFIAIIIAAVAMFAFTESAAAQSRNDVVLSYDQITMDASFNQFMEATAQNQTEILNYLISCAREAYYKCKTIEDLYEVKEQLDIISFYNDNAYTKSISVTSGIRKLRNEIIQTEAEYKNTVVIQTEKKHSYENKGQEY